LEPNEERAVSRYLKLFVLLIGFVGVQPATAQTLDVDAQLKDVVIGDPKAPNTIIEYFSLTCGHCANFHANVLPKIKKNLIDTGKAKFIARDFPLNRLAVLAHMMTRCAPRNRHQPYLDTLFHNFDRWTRSSDPVTALKQIARLGGMGSDEFDACLRNEKLFQAIRKKQDEHAKKFAVDSTPTIIVNGEKVDGNYEAIAKAMKN
tara:strand:- start:506 stop:1117 length:612 start_codon:yes stop_codon:yes gene_type:complete